MTFVMWEAVGIQVDLVGPKASMPAAGSTNNGLTYLAQDEGSSPGTLYKSNGLYWQKRNASVGSLAGGLLRSLKNTVSIPSTALPAGGSTFADIPGFDTMPSFTFSGKPFFIVTRLPQSKNSVASSVEVMRAVIRGGALDGKVLYSESFVSPSTANQIHLVGWTSHPMQECTDGTVLVPGTDYAIKLQIAGTGSGNFSSTFTQDLFGHLSVYEA